MDEFFNKIANICNHVYFILFGVISMVIGFVAFGYKTMCWFVGIAPIIFRFGTALWQREVAIFGSLENYESLKASLIDSKIFKEKNIIHIKSDNIDKANDKAILLVDWDTFGNDIEQVYSVRKNYQTTIVIYAKPASIPHKKMNDIANRANTVVVNFRGRLLNDILTSLVTTSHCKR